MARPRVAFVVIDDGLYTHRWVAAMLADPRLEPVAVACPSPWRARCFNPGGARGLFPASIARLRYYGPRDTLAFALRWARAGGSVAASARAAGVALLDAAGADVNDPAFCGRLRERRPDVVICAFSQKAEPDFLAVPTIGCLNLHFSLLPRHRGREPLFRAMLEGGGAGVSFHSMTAGLDEGRVVAQRPLDLSSLRTLDAAIAGACEIAAELGPEAVLRAFAFRPAAESDLPLPAAASWPSAEDVRRFRARGLRFI